MKRRNIFQLAGAVGAAITGVPGLARPPGPYPGDQVLRKVLTELVDATPPQFSQMISMSDFNPMELKHVNCRCEEITS